MSVLLFFQNVEFEDLDIDKGRKLTQNDFALQMADYKKQVFQAIENNDDEWLRNNYWVQITSKWCKEHFFYRIYQQLCVR